MAHEVLELIARSMELKRKNKETEETLKELYLLVDEYNTFVKQMDQKFDVIVSKMERLADDGH